MVLIERLLLGALLAVALHTTVNHAASIPSTTTGATTTTTTASTTSPASVTSATSTLEPSPTTLHSLLEENASTTEKEALANKTDSRTENARSLDLDISKYTSSDFHNKVYDVQTSPEIDKFVNHDDDEPKIAISKVHTTYRTSFTSGGSGAVHSFDDIELTTPSSKLFDEKHKSLQDEIKQRLEIEEQIESSEEVVGDGDEPHLVKNNNTNVDFVRYSNVLTDEDAKNKTSRHRNYEAAKGFNLHYESVYNQSDVVDESFNTVASPVQLLSNKIEGEKAKRDFSTARAAGISTSASTNQEITQRQSNLLPTLETGTNHEQTHQENNIYPVLVPLPLTTSTTPTATTSSSTTSSIEVGSSTEMYEMTENEFVTTTDQAYEAPDASDEKFYEMTPTEMASSTETPAITESITTTDTSIKTTTLIEEPTTVETITTTPVIEPTTVQSIETTDSFEATITTTSVETTDNPTSTPPTITTTEDTTMKLNRFNLDVKLPTTTDPNDATTENPMEITTITTDNQVKDEPTTISSMTTTNLPSTTMQLSETTTELSEIMDTTTAEVPSITSTITEINAIIKEHPSTESSSTPSNEIKKDNSSANEQDLDDLTEEVTDDDYIDMQNRKAKPIRPSETVPEVNNNTNNNKTSTNSSENASSSTTTESEHDTTTPEEGISTNSEEVVDNDSGSSGTIIAIVLSTVGAICLILLGILLFVMRRRQKRFNYGQRCTPVSLDAYSMDNVSVYNSVRRKAAMRGSKRSYGNPAFDDDTSVSHPLNFQAIIRFANNVEDIKAEFDEIPQVSAKMNELPDGCDTKNRYANVIPLPESRVYLSQLDDDPTSDYINANYVTGPKSARGYYIACQAPMHNTVNDFWRMIWEQQSKVVLMLTHLFENGVEKCVDYLPPSEVVDCHRLFGDFQVTLKKREVKDKYIISGLQLKNMVSNSWREVTHLWYSGWPEKGVPDEEHSLIAFLIEARSYIKLVQNVDSKENGITSNGRGNQLESSPVVVHCSPGTGRTGTVIACDIAIREFELRRVVDIPRIVYRIRRDRASSVQTRDQYHFIYKVINLYATKLTGGALDSI